MPRRATERLSDKLVKALPVPAKGSVVTYDVDLAGFGCRVTEKTWDQRTRFVAKAVGHTGGDTANDGNIKVTLERLKQKAEKG